MIGLSEVATNRQLLDRIGLRRTSQTGSRGRDRTRLIFQGRDSDAGAIAGAIVEIDLRMVYRKQFELLGSTPGTREDFRRLVRTAETGDLHPPVAATYPLADLPAAQAHFRRKDFVGNIVVEP